MSHDLTPAGEIKALVVQHYPISHAELESRRRPYTVALARHVAMFLCRWNGYTLKAVGDHFHRDHTDVVYACRRIRHLITGDTPEARLVLALRAQIPKQPEE